MFFIIKDESNSFLVFVIRDLLSLIRSIIININYEENKFKNR